ncbi:asparagine synthase-related protein [Micromonospora sp. M12]
MISFSGGLDSSLVLAVAVRAARREGLPDPVPVTWRFTNAPRADESDWQDRVIRTLRVSGSWQILRADDDLDLVGPVARRLLHRYGWPIRSTCTCTYPRRARHRRLAVDRRRRRPDPCRVAPDSGRLAARSTVAAAPFRSYPEGLGGAFPWLRPAVARQVHRAFRAEERAEPRQIQHRIAWHTRRRDLQLTCSALATLAADHRATAIQPLLDEGFLSALGCWPATAGASVGTRCSGDRPGCPAGRGHRAAPQGSLSRGVSPDPDPGLRPLVGRHRRGFGAGGRRSTACAVETLANPRRHSQPGPTALAGREPAEQTQAAGSTSPSRSVSEQDSSEIDVEAKT